MAALGAAAIMLVGSWANASIFTSSYEGSALPDDASSNPQWSKFLDSDGASSSVSGGILTISTTASESLAYRLFGGSGNAWDPTGAGSTIEINLKVDSQDAGAGRAGDILIGTGTQEWLLRWGTTVISEELGGGSVAMTTTDAFHTYRFTIPNDEGPLTLYVDGGTTPVMTWAGVDGTADRLDFGDTLDPGDGGTVQWDYIRWTNAGAIAPSVPEPTMLSLAALGGVFLLGRRRRAE
jgi:hypothetical protein